MSEPALGALELSSIARGVVVADALLKRAEVTLIASRPVSGGRHFICFRGDVASAMESMDAAREAAGETILDELLLAHAHETLWALIPDPVSSDRRKKKGTLGHAALIVEAATLCGALAAADAAVKSAEVLLCDARLGVGIAGKAIFTAVGPLPDVLAARDAAENSSPHVLCSEVVPSPTPELAGRLFI